MGIKAAGYRESLRSLLPPGPAWQGLKFRAFVDAFAEELARLEASSEYLRDEAYPGMSEDLLAEWESVVGLPDPDFPQPTTLEARRQTVLARLTVLRSPTKAAIESVALEAGFLIRIDEPMPFYAGQGTAGDPVTGSEWLFVFYVNTFRGLTSDEQARLTSIVKRFKPAHTVAVFDFRDTRLRAGGRCGIRLVTF